VTCREEMRNSYKIKGKSHFGVIVVDKRIIYRKEIGCDDVDWFQLDHENVEMCESLGPIRTEVFLSS
jgi:hypothetical protein